MSLQLKEFMDIKMSKPEIWSTNETEHRYSARLMEAVGYLLATDDPASQGVYGSGLNRFSAEPSETVFIARRCAYDALYNVNTREAPFIEEDIMFIKLEKKIQNVASANEKSEVAESREVAILSSGMLAVALSGSIWGDGALYTGALLGLIPILVAAGSDIGSSKHLPQTMRNWLVSGIRVPLEILLNEKGGLDSLFNGILWSGMFIVAFGGLIWGDVVLFAGGFFGALFAVTSVPNWVLKLFRNKRRRILLNEIESGLRVYRDKS